MNEITNQKERTERKRALGDIKREVMGRSPSSTVKRPSRACSSQRRLPNVSDGGAAFVSSSYPLHWTSSKDSNDYGLSAERPPSRPSASRTALRAVSLALATSVPKERLALRNLWEMAAVMNFFCVFRHIINNLPEFTMDDLESALLNPNSVLDTIHVVLLKGVPPAARVPLRGDTWPTVLSKKFKDWWLRVAEGPCPLVPCQGAELASYLELDAPTRVRVLLALCEMRVDQDDARLYIDNSMKRNHLPVVVRKDRSGCGAEGTTFWLEEDPLMGQRLYREGHVTIPVPPPKNKGRGWGRGRNVPPPVPGSWETVATNFEDFQEVSTRLLESQNRLEAAMGKKLMQSLMPQLEEVQKKKDRMVKRQQREAVLLDNMVQGNGLAAGRSRRERKPVTYTFDEFDRSISEAIKFTKKNVSQSSMRHGNRNWVNEVNGFRERERNENATDDQVAYENGGVVGVRRSSRNFRSQPRSELGECGQAGDVDLQPHLVKADSGFSDDDIEGEAVYDDDYLAARQRKGSYSSESGESFRKHDRYDAYFDEFGKGEKDAEDSDLYGGNFNGRDSDRLGSEERVLKRPRPGPKVRLVNDLSREDSHRIARMVSDRTRGSDDEGCDFNEQMVRDGQQRLRSVEGVRVESSPQGLGHNCRNSADVRFEEVVDCREARGCSSEIRNGKHGVLLKEKRNSDRAPSIEDGTECIGYSRVQLVQPSALLDEDQQEAGSVDFDEQESTGTGTDVEDREGSGRRRQLLDLNEVAMAVRGSSPLSEDGKSEYSEDELGHDAEAG